MGVFLWKDNGFWAWYFTFTFVKPLKTKDRFRHQEKPKIDESQTSNPTILTMNLVVLLLKVRPYCLKNTFFREFVYWKFLTYIFEAHYKILKHKLEGLQLHYIDFDSFLQIFKTKDVNKAERKQKTFWFWWLESESISILKCYLEG